MFCTFFYVVYRELNLLATGITKHQLANGTERRFSSLKRKTHISPHVFIACFLGLLDFEAVSVFRPEGNGWLCLKVSL